MPPPLLDPATSSPLSSPDSFITAEASPPNPLDITVTDIDAPDDDAPRREYYSARQLPPELKQHCQIYLEENLHILALRVLGRLQSSSSALLPPGTRWTPRRQESSDHVYCPAPNVLAFLSTLTVHPDLTTRPREDHWSDVSSAALDYLRNILNTVGPVNARLHEAFRFGQATRRSPSGDSDDFVADVGGEAQLYGRYGKHGVWRRGHDFFNVVGWALNCSVLYPNRWEYWRQWLDFMLEVIEKDLDERKEMDEQGHFRAGGEEGECKYSSLSTSILAGYLNQRNGRTGGLKWVIKVIFADGQGSASSLFQEIWDKEHKGRSRNKAFKKRKRKINIEKGDFGELLDDDSVYSSQNSEPPTPQKRKTYSNRNESPALEASYVESIALRQRLFAALSYLCHFLPAPPIDLPDLYESYETQIRSLPLSLFTAFIDSTTSSLRLDSQISVLQDVLIHFMPSSAVNPSKVDREIYDANGTSPAILERCFLPYAANTIATEDNAKVSVLLEELVKLVWMEGTAQFSDGFYDAVAKGIKAREAKIKKKVAGTRGKRNGYAQEDPDTEARTVLQESSSRLRQLVELISEEASGEDAETDEPEKADKTYCLCRQIEHGDMVACDNPNCSYGWFHWKCIGLKSEPKGRWLCPQCRQHESDEMDEGML
ncbi:hypothetical protein TruAng_000012 [Truncatella angustata]|nr:hypothetical protein TruAng_000012 [Truncatella angustata]